MGRVYFGVAARAFAVLLMAMAGSHAALAEGALAMGLPDDVAKIGFTYGANVNAPNAAESSRLALKNCQTANGVSPALKALCAVTQTFHGQCVAVALDPEKNTPGVGWAVAADRSTAGDQALAMCRSKTPANAKMPANSPNACRLDSVRCDGTEKLSHRAPSQTQAGTDADQAPRK